MVNLIGLANHLREEFPVPANYQVIYKSMTKWLGKKPSDETQYDAYKALVKLWERGDWIFDNDVGAVRTNDGEEITFDDDAITIASGHGGSTMVFTLARGDRHDRVIWF